MSSECDRVVIYIPTKVAKIYIPTKVAKLYIPTKVAKLYISANNDRVVIYIR